MVDVVTENVFWNTPTQITVAMVVIIYGVLLLSDIRVRREKQRPFRSVGVLILVATFGAAAIGIRYNSVTNKNSEESVAAIEEAYGVEFNERHQRGRLSHNPSTKYVIPAEGSHIVLNDVYNAQTGVIYPPVKVSRENDKITLFVPESEQSNSYVELPLVNE